MRPAGVAETVQVTGELPAPIATPVIGTTSSSEEIETLATPRTIQGIAQLAPAVNENSPNTGQLIINGAFAFDNVFMINGVDINDNLFATATESLHRGRDRGDAGADVRHLGGIRPVHRRRDQRDHQERRQQLFGQRPDQLPEPVLDDRDAVRGLRRQDIVVVHGADATSRQAVEDLRRHVRRSDRARSSLVLRCPAATSPPSSPIDAAADGHRACRPPTRTSAARSRSRAPSVNNHTVQGGYLNDPRKRTNNSGLQSFIIDPHSEVDRENPNWYSYTNYRGVLGSNGLAEAQYSERRFQFKGDGGTEHEHPRFPVCRATCDVHRLQRAVLRRDRPGAAQQPAAHRQHHELTGMAAAATKPSPATSSSAASGQAATRSRPPSYVFGADYLTDCRRHPVLDRNGRLIPGFVPGESHVEYFPATQGRHDEHRQPLPLRAGSLDDQRPVVGRSRRAVRAGECRLHRATSRASTPAASCRVSLRPTTSAATATTSCTSRTASIRAAITKRRLARTARSATRRRIDATYRGPAGQGYDFAPGMNLANYPITPANASVNDPLQNVIMEDGLRSPLVHEFSHVVRRESVRWPRICRGQLRLPQDDQPDRRLPDTTTGTTERRGGWASAPASSRTSCIGTPTTSPAVSTRPGVPVAIPDQEQLERERPLHACSSRTTATTRAKATNQAGRRVADRQFSRDLHRSALLPGRPAAELPAQPLPHVEHLQLRTWARRAICRFRACGAWKASRVYSLAARNQGITGDADSHSRGGRISGRAAAAPHVLRRRARHRTVPGLRPARRCRSTTTSRCSVRCGPG